MTPEQAATLDAITAFFQEKGYSPSIREIAAMRRCGAPSSIHKQVHALIEQGYLQTVRSGTRHRNFAPTNPLARYSTKALQAELSRRSA